MQDIRDLKESSAKVETQFAEIHKIYDEFQARFDEIHATMQNIVGIANQTNLLALNASIEAVPVNTEKDLPLLHDSNNEPRTYPSDSGLKIQTEADFLPLVNCAVRSLYLPAAA